MRKRTVLQGLRLILIGILCVTAASFFHRELAQLFALSGRSEARLTFIGFLSGGLAGGCGVLFAAAGLLQSETQGSRVRLTPLFLLIVFSIFLFFYFAFSSFTTPSKRPIHPGETIAI